MKLICELTETVDYELVEEDGKPKKYFIEGIFMQSEKKNKNGRIYPLDVLEKEVGRYVKEYVEPKRAFGELGHPDGPTVNLDRASHMITALYPDGKSFVGEAKILSTPMGEIVKSLIDEGAKLGVSSRGMGSLEQKNGAHYVRNDFYLATAADIVSDPSAPNAFVQGIMEGKEWVWNHGALVEAELVRMKTRIERKTRTKHAKEDALEFAKFLKML